MTTQSYCMINLANNVCENLVMWDGNTETWPPPEGYLLIPQAQVPAKVWQIDVPNNCYTLEVVYGAAEIGFGWDGTYLMTNQPQPPAPMTE